MSDNPWDDPGWKACVDLPLPQRMRVAADVLTEVNDRQNYGHISAYGRGDLLKLADRWEREDADRLGRDKHVEELAGVIGQHSLSQVTGETHRDLARKLINAGWTKVTGDE